MPRRDRHDLARVLADKAAADEAAVEGYADDPKIRDEVFAFHAQQAVEKRLKSVLAMRGIEFERTHNLAYLLRLLADNDIPEPPGSSDLAALTPWATNLRYEDTTERTVDRATTRRLVEAVHKWADNLESGRS